jgi:glutamate-5-semialdehyde dehydrogenase
MKTVVEKTLDARKAYNAGVALKPGVRDDALMLIADAVEKNVGKILSANAVDVKLAVKGRLQDALVKRLRLTGEKVREMAVLVREVASLENPIGRTLLAMELDRGLVLYRVSTPIGVIGFIFESRPDVLPQIASLCLKTGNSVVMKGGSEAAHSNRVLYDVIDEASRKAGIPKGWLQLVESRSDVGELLKLDGVIDLLIPRGGEGLVKHVKENTKIPVLGHADGICHAYVDRDADVGMAVRVCFDAKIQYPAVCNAIETLLVDEKIAKRFLPKMAAEYRKAGVELRVDEKSRVILKGFKTKNAREEDWRTEYNDLIISIKTVSGVEEAVGHINTYGSHHTDAIITRNKKTAGIFLRDVDSSSVMHNCSTRFSDGFRYGFGAEVGISTGKIHARGPVGLEGLTTYKYVLEGSGQLVKDYVGDNARKFTHRRLNSRWNF